MTERLQHTARSRITYPSNSSNSFTSCSPSFLSYASNAHASHFPWRVGSTIQHTGRVDISRRCAAVFQMVCTHNKHMFRCIYTRLVACRSYSIRNESLLKWKESAIELVWKPVPQLATMRLCHACLVLFDVLRQSLSISAAATGLVALQVRLPSAWGCMCYLPQRWRAITYHKTANLRTIGLILFVCSTYIHTYTTYTDK